MYAQVEKPKEKKSRAIANSVTQKKINTKQGFGFVDNRSKAIVQRNVKLNNTSIIKTRHPLKFDQSKPLAYL